VRRDPEIEIDQWSLTASLCYWYAARYTEFHAANMAHNSIESQMIILHL
jgi:hypothetical protein